MDHDAFTVGQPATTSFPIVTTVGLPSKTTITYTGSLPTGVKLTDLGNGTATLTGTPAAGGAATLLLPDRHHVEQCHIQGDPDLHADGKRGPRDHDSTQARKQSASVPPRPSRPWRPAIRPRP